MSDLLSGILALAFTAAFAVGAWVLSNLFWMSLLGRESVGLLEAAGLFFGGCFALHLYKNRED